MARLPEAITTTSPAAAPSAARRPPPAVGRVCAVSLAAGPLEVHLVVHRPSVQGPVHRVPGRAVLAAHLRQERVGRPGGLLQTRRRGHGDVAVGHQGADQLLQRLAVPLPEGGALALAVVREDDELIGPWGVRGRHLQHPDEVVEAGQRGQRLRPGRTGVVGDLVVVGEVAVERRGPGHHLLDDQPGVEVAQQHVRDGPEEHVGAVPVDPGLHVAALLSPGLVQLLEHLPHRQHEGAAQPVGVDEERGVAAGRPVAAPSGDAAHRQQRGRGVAGEDVGDAHAPVGQQPATVAQPLLDLGGVPGVVGHQQPARVLLVPPERRHLPAGAVQQPGLAGGCGGRQLHVPGRRDVAARAHPPGQGRQVPALDRPLQQRCRQPVDLDEDHTRRRGGRSSRSGTSATAAAGTTGTRCRRRR